MQIGSQLNETGIFVSAGVKSFPNVGSFLKSEPELRSCVENAGKSMGQIECDGPTLVNEITYYAARNAKAGS